MTALPYYDEPPTKLEILTAQVSKTAKSEAIGSVHPISVRLPTILYTTIQAISQHSGMSMNKTIAGLLDVAVDELWSTLPQEECDEISRIRSSFIQEVMKGTSAQASEGEI